MNRIPPLALLAALALAGCAVKDADAVSLPPAGAQAPGATAPAPDRDAGAAAAGDPADAAAEVVPFTGTVEPHRRSTLTPKIPATVARVHVRDGDRAREGEPLVTFETRDVRLRLRQARAALEGAKVQRDAAMDEWRRVKALSESQAVARAQLEGVEFKRRGAEAGVTAAQVGVEMAQKAVGDSVIRAPYDCVVVRRLVNEGDYAMTMPPTPLLVVEETGVLDLRVLVPSSEMNGIREGDPVTVSFPSLGTALRASVTRIVASVDPRSRTFSAIIEIPNGDGALMPGLFAEARFDGSAGGAARP